MRRVYMWNGRFVIPANGERLTADELRGLAREAAECGDVCDTDGCVTCDPEAQ